MAVGRFEVPRSQGRLVLVFLAVAAVVGLLGYAVYHFQAVEVQRHDIERLESVAVLKARQVEAWLGERRADAQVLSRGILDPRQLARLFSAPDGRAAAEILVRLDLVRSQYGYASIELFDSSGRRRLFVGEPWHNSLASHPDVISVLGERKEPYLVNFSPSETEARSSELSVAVAVSDPSVPEAGPVAYVLLNIDPSATLFPALKSWPSPTHSAETLLVERRGDKIAHHFAAGQLEHFPTEAKPAVDRKQLPAYQALFLGKRVIDGVDRRGIAVLAVAEAIEGTSWVLIAKMDRDEVLGDLRHLAIRAILGALGIILAAAVILLLLLRQQRLLAAVEVAQHERAFRVILDNSADAVFIFDPEGRCLYANNQAGSLVDRSPTELVDMLIWELTPADSLALVREGIERLKERRQVRSDLTLLRKNGSAFPVDLNAIVLPDGNLLASCRDMSDLKRVASELEEHRHRLEEKVAERTRDLEEARKQAVTATLSKSQFLANMSHEIRTPINAIIGLTHRLRKSGPTAEQEDRLGKIAGAAEHLLSVINNILDFSKIEAGKLEVERTDFDPRELLERVCAMVLERVQDKGLELVVDCGELPARVEGDPTRITQALLNYLANAIKFADRGTVVLRTRVLESDGETLLARFEVEDQGIGIPADRMSQLVSPFEQADASTTRRFGGTGLGLAVTRSLARLMGGEAGAVSTPGAGSTFWLTVRLGVAAAPVPDLKPDLQGKRVLVADDVPVTREVLVRLLTGLGMECEAAPSGLAAVAAFTAARDAGKKFDFALLDLHMPDLDGIEAYELMADACDGAMPVGILVTASGEENIAALARDAGMRTVLQKPVTVSTLAKILSDSPIAIGDPSSPEGGLELGSQRVRSQGSRVLLAEDDPINQEIAVELLQDFGLVVDVANDGEEAVSRVMGGDYRLILMDMQMPRLDGIGATRKIRSQLGADRLPIIAMTANAFVEDRDACFAAGMNDFVSKPVDPDDLLRVLDKWIVDSPA